MLAREQIPALVRLLNDRNVALFHACQLRDLKSYIRIGGIPSRAQLESSGQRFTEFVTDSSDKQNGVWHRVFVNPEDHGSFFAFGHNWTPNPYGPIQIQLLPEVLLEAGNVAWTIRSAGVNGFDLVGESLRELETIDSLFVYPRGTFLDERDSIFHYTNDIKRLLGDHRARRPEINCEFDGQKIAVESWIIIHVEDYQIGNRTLLDEVKSFLDSRGVETKVVERFYTRPRRRVIREIWNSVKSGARDFNEVYASTVTRSETREYLDGISLDLSWQFDRYMRYLVEGTLTELDNGSSSMSGDHGVWDPPF